MTARPEPDFRELETFVAVADEGSFTAAARRLGTNQPTVSGRIASLEGSLGVRLFDRGPRHTAPTPAGLALVSTARRILKSREELLRSVAHLSEEPAGELFVASSTVPASYVLPAALATLRTTAPKVKARVLVGDTRRTLAALRTGNAELAIVGAPIDDDSLVAEEVARDAIVLVASPEFASKHELMHDGATLADVPLVLREEGSATRELAMSAAMATGTAISALDIVFEAQGNDAVREALRAGLGAGFLSRLAIRRELDEGSLVQLDSLAQPVERVLYMVAHKGRTLSPGAAALAAVLRDR